MWAHQDLNLGPAGYEPAALNQAELWAPKGTSSPFMVATIASSFKVHQVPAPNSRYFA